MDNQYVRNKLSIKLNMIMSQGEKKEGVVADAIIDKLLRIDSENYYGFDNFGLYEIIWDKEKFIPIALMRLDDGYTCEKSGSNYILFYKGACKKALFWSQIIDFNTKEYREEQLKLLLDE